MQGTGGESIVNLNNCPLPLLHGTIKHGLDSTVVFRYHESYPLRSNYNITSGRVGNILSINSLLPSGHVVKDVISAP